MDKKLTDIITVCTENYFDALDFVLPSWLACPSVRRIFLYSDAEYSPNPRLICRKILEKSEDWTKNVGYKPLALLDYLAQNELSDNFVFFDVDVYAVRDFCTAWDFAFDVGVTRLLDALVTRPVYAPQYPATVSSGALFFRRSPKSSMFIKAWNELQNAYLGANRIREGAWCYDQLSIHELCITDIEGANRFQILDLDAAQYNSEHHDENYWVKSVAIRQPSLLHFKRRRWRDKDLVAKVLNAANRLS